MKSKTVLIGLFVGLLIGAGGSFALTPRPDVSGYKSQIEQLKGQAETLQNRATILKNKIEDLQFQREEMLNESTKTIWQSEGVAREMLREELKRLPGTLEQLRYIRVPAPLLAPDQASWDSVYTECPMVFLDEDNVYYMFYHAPGTVVSYQIGVATAASPYGPFTKYAGNPILTVGAAGEWDDFYVSSPFVFREGDTYYMFYSGYSSATGIIQIGLATATSPTGPWTKHPNNPILRSLHWVWGVVKVGDTYYLYYGGNLATAPSPEGPWTEYSGNPVLEPDPIGWDMRSYAESAITYDRTMFHAWLSGTKGDFWGAIGYAFSVDGKKWYKHPLNPVVTPTGVSGEWDEDRLSEVRAFIYNDLVLLYYTGIRRPGVVYPMDTRLGLSVGFPPGRKFRIPSVVLDESSIAALTTTALTDCELIDLKNVATLALTVECTFNGAATDGIRVHIRTSPDGSNWDTEDLDYFDPVFAAGDTVRKTIFVDADARYVKVLVENLDSAQAITDVKVTATLGG